jgi:hypothetical protein
MVRGLETRLLSPALMLLVDTAIVALASAPPALAQPAPGEGGGAVCLLGPLCHIGDPSMWLQQTVTELISNILNGIVTQYRDAIVGFVNDVNFLTHTPENLSYDNGLVKQFATATQALANGLLAVIVLVSGYNVMLRPYVSGTYAGALELLPRLLLGGILINTAAWWCRLAIDANNAACAVFGAPSIADVVSAVVRALVPTAGPGQVWGLLMIAIFMVMAVLLLIQQLMRLALVNVLLVLAPLAALLWILPQTQAWGRRWGVLFVGTVFGQAVQVLTLHLGFGLTTNLPPATAAGLLQPLLGIAVLALALKVPSLMGGGAAGGNVVSSLIGTAAGAVVATGAGVGVRTALGAGTHAMRRGASMSSNARL